MLLKAGSGIAGKVKAINKVDEIFYVSDKVRNNRSTLGLALSPIASMNGASTGTLVL